MRYKFIIFGLILICFIALTSLNTVSSEIKNLNKVTYRNVTPNDIPNLISIYNYGKDKGGWCHIDNDVSKYTLWEEYRELYDVFGDNLSITVAEKHGQILSVIIAGVEGDSVFYKGIMWDMKNVDEELWLELIHQHVGYVAQWGKSKGAVTISTEVTPSWLYHYTDEILKAEKINDNKFIMRILDYEKLNVDYQTKLNTVNRTIKETIPRKIIPSGATIINSNILKKGNTYYSYSFPVAYKKNGEWKEISLNPKDYGNNIDYLGLNISNDGKITFKGLTIEIDSIYTDNKQMPILKPNVFRKKMSKNSIVFENITNGIDYGIELKRNGFSLNTIIKRKPNLIYKLNLSNSKDKTFYIKYHITGNQDKIDKLDKLIPKNLFAEDSNKKIIKVGRKIIKGNKEGYIIESLPLGRVMNDIGYPLKIDPLFEKSVSQDVYLTDGTDTGLWHLKFPIGSISGTVSKAELKIYYYDNNKNLNSPITHRNISSNWTESDPCSVFDAGSDIGGTLDTVSIVKDDHRFYVYNVTGDGNGVSWAVSNNKDNITFRLKQGGGSCNSVLDNTNFISQSGTVGKKVNAYSSEGAIPPVLEVTINDTINPNVEFVLPTPSNNTVTTNKTVDINVSINDSSLKDVIFNWNGTNFTIFNDSTVFIIKSK